MRLISKRLAGILALLCSITAASAHPVFTPTLPVHHAVLLAKHPFLGFPTNTSHALQSQLLASQLHLGLGGSQSTRSLLSELKSITSASFSQGQASSIITQASIKFGSLNGEEFLAPFGSSTYSNSGPHYMAIGSNPLASITGTGNTAGTPNFPAFNILNLTQTNGSISTLTTSKILAFKGVTPDNSGASRAFKNLFKSAAEGGYKAGSSSVALPAGITGGQFSGTIYLSNNLLPGAPFGLFGEKFIYAFGNNPLNSPSHVGFTLANPANYILFSNGVTKNISSAGLFVQYYTSGVGSSNFVPHYFAIGNNPFNLSPVGSFVPSSLLSYINF
jgi:hypothetical protein